jgi:ATP-dependent 26S proteasome regulatory subunit
VILPEPTLEALERHTMGISRHGDALVAAGRSLKRGLLLHGAPGTGKTHSLAYLISQMPDRTVVVLTGQGLGGIGRAFALARALGPAMVVLEDVDLVAMARDLPGQEVNPLLFELLNQMDGLAADTDLVVMLTTNRADLLEPALAARPGRIDQALETPIPDAEARRRLFHLYGTGIDLRLERLDEHVANTEGAVPAFIKELMRRAVLESLMASGNSVVDDSVMERVIADMVSSRDMVVRSLLGAPSGTKPGEPAGASDEPNPLG